MSSVGLRWVFLEQNLILLPKKAIFWEEEKALIISDLHIGKVGHFRKAGIAIPKLMEQEELATLSDLIHDFKPSQLIFLGDLFHSDMNNDWNWLELWRELYPTIKMILIQGNHDILHEDYYQQANFELHNKLRLGPFLFVHDKKDFEKIPPENVYVLSGHIHPAIRLRGRARQSVLLSCFSFGKTAGILPAFGKFTGKCCLKENEDDTVFGILNDKVILLKASLENH
ncbi:ligase-associated DNA damage response endonuclease PdeM [Pedobacter sp. P351]|uniref:ligase-associated DNA damage response endonuclease PdeM n=1 Tax=Pedobacter superstes TaxID=3133441 RepID=UPI0030992535